MSGFEIAGLVLGAIPLLIQGVKLVFNGALTVKDMVQYRQRFLNSYITFTVNLVDLRNGFDIYLSKLKLAPSKYQELTERSEPWKDEEVATELRRALGTDGCEAFLNVCTRTLENFKRLGRSLGLNDDFSVPFSSRNGSQNGIDKKSFARFFKKQKGALLQEHYQSFMADIKSDIDQLDRLFNRSMAAEDVRRQWRSSDNVHIPDQWLEMQPYSLNLYDAIANSWPQSCGTSHRHDARLLLQIPERKEPHLATPSFEFSFIVQSIRDDSNTLPWTQRDIIVNSQKCITKKLPHVKFQFPDTSDSSDSSSDEEGTSSRVIIDDLCNSFGEQCSDTSYLGSFVCNHYHYHAHIAGALWTWHDKLDRLSSILAGRRRKVLHPKERNSVALALASAVLQLYDTPWLGNDWGLDDLHFKQTDNGYRLFIHEIFNQHPDPHDTTKPCRKNVFVIKNRTLFSLCIALLELFFAQKLSDCMEEDVPQDEMARLETVGQLVEELNCHMSSQTSRYTRAVNWCFEPKIDVESGYQPLKEYSFTSYRFRQRFVEEVVAPLLKEYEAICL